MGPVARSAFEVYQEINKKKKVKKPHLHHQYLMAELSGVNCTSQNGRAKALKSEEQKPKAQRELKKKALKRLTAGPSKPPTSESGRGTQQLRKKFDESPAGPAAMAVAGSVQRQKSAGNSIKISKEKSKNDSANVPVDGPIKNCEKAPERLVAWEYGGTSSSEEEKPPKKVEKRSYDDDLVNHVKVVEKKEKKRKCKDSKDDVGKPAELMIDETSSSQVESPPKKAKKKKQRKDLENQVGKLPKSLVHQAPSSEGESPPKKAEKKKKKPKDSEKGFSKKFLEPLFAGHFNSSSTEEETAHGVPAGEPPKFLVDENVPVFDSTKSGREMLEWLLTPVQLEPFIEKYWEQRPLFISRSFHRNFLQGILRSEDIDQALRDNSLQFTRNIDVTTYIDGVRETHNPVGRAHAFTVWDYYRNGCSVRILNPQTYFPKLRKMCTTLQECFNSFVGANVYLTPPNSQGFAPHFDDIEAFVLQLEGRKKWKVYPPRKGQKLPRVSSHNFTQEDMVEPVLEIELQPGDLLYMPRGFVHQATTVPNTHSLHVTISTYLRNSWADVMEKLVPAALASAIESDTEFREGIPWDFLHNTGVMYSTDDTRTRRQIGDKIKRLFSKLFDHAPIDAAADQLAKEFLHESLPPMLQSSEVALSVHGDHCRMKDGNVAHLKQLTPNSSIKLVRRNVLRLVAEDDDTVKVYHCAENPLVYKEEEQKWCEVLMESAPAVEALIRNYPKYTRVSDLPCKDDDNKVLVAMALWERGMLLTKEPIEEVSFSED